MFISSEFLFWFPWPLLLLTLCAGFPLSLSLSAYSLRYVMPSFQFDSVTLFFYSKTCESWTRYTPLQSDFIVIQLAFFKTNWIFWNNWQSGASTFGLIFRHLYFGCFFVCFFLWFRHFCSCVAAGLVLFLKHLIYFPLVSVVRLIISRLTLNNSFNFVLTFYTYTYIFFCGFSPWSNRYIFMYLKDFP